ncbi:MAG: hypothetical protein ACREOA_10075 [Candidatus Dormibacteria bacterium]
MNQVECWFSILHPQAIQRGVFRSVRALMDAIRGFLDGWETHQHPFAGVKTLEQVLRHPRLKAIPRTVY